MNSNDFVVLPNNKAKSVKLKARNMQELQLKTVTLGQERQEMEEKLQQLKESMSKEKEERGYSGWKSGQCDSLISNALTNSTKKSKEIMLQKLSAGKVKIRVLKDEPLTAPPQPPPPPPAISSRAARKNRLRGRYCGQCEVKTAGLMCAECTEDYCIGCFTKFHQKGALKLHRIIPIQTDLQTHVSTRDVVSCFQKQIDPCSHPSNFTNLNPSSSFSSSPKPKPSPSHSIKSNATTRQGHGRTEEGTEAVAKPMQLSPDHMQVLAVNQAKEKKVEMTEEGLNRADERAVPTDLFSGEYNEEDSARSFQEALRQWRGEKSDGAEEPMSEEAMWIPVRPVSAMATQADLTSDRRAEGRGRGGGEGRVPVRVEFTENSLTYLDRLLLKKHRRTPIETYHPPLVFCADLNSLPNINTEDDTGSSLTAQEEDFHRYCASLFAVAVSSGRTEPEITTPESCLTIEVLDERDRDVDGDVVVEQKTDNIKVPSIQELHCQVRTPVPQTALTSGGSSRVSRSSPRPIQTSRQSRSPALHNAAQKLHLSKTTGAEHSIKSSSSKSKPSARPTAETPRTSKTLIKTPTSTSQKPNCSPTVHKSKPDHGSTRFLSSPSLPHIQTEIPKSSHAPLSFPPDVSSLAGARPPIPEEHLSLRSTFTLSPSGSTESIFLPKVDQSNPFHEGSDSSLLPEQARSSQLFPEPVSSLKLSQSPPSNLESSRKSPNRPCDPESLLSDYQLQPSLSPVPSSPNLPRKYPRPLKSLFRVSLLNDSLPDAYSRQMSTPTNENAPDQESTLSLQYAKSNPSLPLNVLHSPHSAVKMDEEEEELSIDSGDEMSSDSLGVASHEEDSSDEGHSTRGRPGDEEREISDIHAEGKKDFQSDEKEQLSEPLMVMHKQIAGSGSEHFSDLDVSLPLGLDVNCGHSDTPKHTHWDSHQTSPYDSEPKGSQGYWPTSSLSSYTEEHLVFEMVKDNTNQSTGIQIHSATPTGRGEISANEPGTSGSGSNRSTPTASQAPATCCLSHPISCSELGTVPRPLSRAAQEIMEICSVDQTGCEDPDLETDRTAHTLYKLEEELRLLSKEIGKQAPVFGAGNSGSQYQHENHPSTRGRDSEDQKEEDEAVQTDQRSVLLLP